jgi:hypothetical protein
MWGGVVGSTWDCCALQTMCASYVSGEVPFGFFGLNENLEVKGRRSGRTANGFDGKIRSSRSQLCSNFRS